MGNFPPMRVVNDFCLIDLFRDQMTYLLAIICSSILVESESPVELM